MPFGPVKVPSFYSCMMSNLNKDWDALFAEMEELAISGDILDNKRRSSRTGTYNYVLPNYAVVQS